MTADDKLDEMIRGHFKAPTLSENRLDAILAQGNRVSANQKRSPARTVMNSLTALVDGLRAPQLAGLAAAAMLALMVTSGVLYDQSRNSTIDHMNKEKVLAGFSVQHDAMDTPAMPFTQLASAGDMLPAVNFAIDPKPRMIDGLTLTGGNYCNMGGIIGAELQFIDRKMNQRMTLFAMPMDSTFKAMTNTEINHDGLVFDSWEQDGVFYALVRPAGCSPEHALTREKPCARGPSGEKTSLRNSNWQ
ncbi:MAG: hypothetical protein Alpg2KO_15830 [Alphaproteobacteria bacterium]